MGISTKRNELGNTVKSCALSLIYYLEFEWRNKSRFVRIHFNTPKFDRITKDQAAKFADVLEAPWDC